MKAHSEFIKKRKEEEKHADLEANPQKVPCSVKIETSGNEIELSEFKFKKGEKKGSETDNY